MAFRIVVVGGAGNFGARIVRALAPDSGMDLVSAGRDAKPVPGAPAVPAVALDLSTVDFPARLRALEPGLVIHCAGPFQAQGYVVAEAALAAGAHYIDLADGRAFVAGFRGHLDVAARAADRAAITGASTLPALSTAVIDALSPDAEAVERIATVIAPGQRAPRGIATLAAVLTYLGRPFPVWRDGAWTSTWGWMDLRTVRLDFGTRLSAACDVPDLELLPLRYPRARDVSFHAALEFRLQHAVLWALAALRRAGLPLPVDRWAAAFEHYAAFFDRWAGERGGMRVQVVTREGERLRARTWQLSAPALHGPEIPCMAAVLLARRISAGHPVPAGARACMGLLTLADFEPEFARWGMTHRIVEERVG